MLIVDAKGSLGSLPQLGTLYEPPCVNLGSSHALWEGKIDLFSHPPEEKNDFLKVLEAEDAKYQTNVDEDKDVCFGKLCFIYKLIKLFYMSVFWPKFS